MTEVTHNVRPHQPGGIDKFRKRMTPLKRVWNDLKTLHEWINRVKIMWNSAFYPNIIKFICLEKGIRSFLSSKSLSPKQVREKKPIAPKQVREKKPIAPKQVREKKPIAKKQCKK